MERRDFIRRAGAAGLMVAAGPSWVARAKAAEPRRPMGRPLGPEETLLVHDAKLVDVVGQRLFNETAVLIRGGKIEKRLSEDVGADRKIDAGGRYLIPGLINAHCHITGPGVIAVSISLILNIGRQRDRNCVDCVTHGVTTVRDQGGRQETLIKMQDRISKGELMGPRIFRGIGIDVPGGYLGRIGSSGPLRPTNVAEARDAVKAAADMGADHIKTALQYLPMYEDSKPLEKIPDEILTAIVDKAASLGLRCAIHHTCTKGFKSAMVAGIQSFEHMSCDRLLTDEEIQEFIDQGRAVVPTGSVAWALAYPVKGDPNSEHPRVQRIYRDKEERVDSLLEEFALDPLVRPGKKMCRKWSSPGYFDKKHLMITPSARFYNSAGAIGGDNMMKMYRAGCKVGVGNDGGIPFVWAGSLPYEMLLAQVSGMKPADILRNATATNAEIIGIEDSVGTLDDGKTADMVLLDDNPLEDVENVGNAVAVLQSGRLVHTKGDIKEALF